MSLYGEDFYLPGATVPEPFLAADRLAAEKHKNDPKVITKPKEIPMPFIKGCPGAKGPIIITEDWYVKQKKKKASKKAKEKKDMQIEMMQLLAQRDMLRNKLGELDPSKKRDSKKIVAINIKLKDIDAELKMLQEQSGINLDELDHGSKLGRFMGRLKRGCKRIIKKVKKFYKNNRELILGIAGIVVPIILGGIAKKIAGLFA